MISEPRSAKLSPLAQTSSYATGQERNQQCLAQLNVSSLSTAEKCFNVS